MKIMSVLTKRNGDLSKGGEHMIVKNKITTYVNFILDRSGSMESIRDRTIDGFNEYLVGLRKQKGKLLFSLTLFSSEGVEASYVKTPISEVAPLSRQSFNPSGGTPLYDAVVRTVEKAAEEETKAKSANLVVIMTDGEENSSTEHNEKCLRELVERLQAKGNWTFAYLGANQDAWANSQKWGISAGNTMDWASTSAGTEKAFRGLAMASANYMSAMSDNGSKGIAMSASNFFDNTKGGDLNDSQS